VTWAFAFLITCLGGFTLALVTGLVRRIIHPTELCDHVVEPSHEHWASQHTPLLDLLISFVTVFGLTAFLVHGFTSVQATHAVAVAVVAGVIGAVLLRVWLRSSSDPSTTTVDATSTGTVVHEIPPSGYGQIEISLSGAAVKIAARSVAAAAIPAGAMVRVVECRESVVVVEPMP
jgi:membrane protein implicated in regulation of membrane protease activity